MNIKNRLKNLEQIASAKTTVNNEPEICEHPASMFNLRREYPATGYSDRRLVIMGHCNVCGFDDYLWSFNALTEEQEIRRWELKYASKFWESMAYDLDLINAGLLRYALYPPSPEVQIQFTGEVQV